MPAGGSGRRKDPAEAAMTGCCRRSAMTSVRKRPAARPGFAGLSASGRGQASRKTPWRWPPSLISRPTRRARSPQPTIYSWIDQTCPGAYDPHQHLRPHPARRDPEQDRAGNAAYAGVPRHPPAGPGACAGDPEGGLCVASTISPPRPRRKRSSDFHRTVAKVCAILGLTGGRASARSPMPGRMGMQEVPHYHLHILGGRVMGRMLERG
jgi:hypothetical protein